MTVIIGLIWWLAPAFYSSVQAALPTGWTGSHLAMNTQYEEEIASLKAEISQLRRERRQLKLQAPNAKITASSTLPDTYVQATVLVRPPQTPYDTLLVNKGGGDQLQNGAMVWWPPGVLLGKVDEVRSNTALVQLLSSPGLSHTGRFDERVTLEVVGQGGGKMLAEAPGSADIATGTTAVSDQYGVPFGEVVRVQPAETVAKDELIIRPIVPASILEYVYVQQ